jgi:hypothetical protein
MTMNVTKTGVVLAGVGVCICIVALTVGRPAGAGVLRDEAIAATYGGSCLANCDSSGSGCEPPYNDGCVWSEYLQKCTGLQWTTCVQGQKKCQGTAQKMCTDLDTPCTGQYWMYSCILKDGKCQWGDGIQGNCMGNKTGCTVN